MKERKFKGGQKIKHPERCLQVRFTDPVGEDGQKWAMGWYVFVLKKGVGSKKEVLTPHNFKAILLRFRRKVDAEIARRSLLAQGLVTFHRVSTEPAMNVLRIMTENLQW